MSKTWEELIDQACASVDRHTAALERLAGVGEALATLAAASSRAASTAGNATPAASPGSPSPSASPGSPGSAPSAPRPRKAAPAAAASAPSSPSPAPAAASGSPSTPSPAPAAPVADGAGIKYDTVREAVIKLAETKGHQVAVGVLAQFGAKNGKDVKPAQWPELLKAVETAAGMTIAQLTGKEAAPIA